MNNNGKIIPVVCIIVVRDEKMLVGKRLTTHVGKYSDPGGKLEFGEPFFQRAHLELAQETGLLTMEFEHIETIGTVDHERGEHYITIFMLALNLNEDQPVNKEPDKCEGWEWHDPLTLVGDQMMPSLNVLISNQWNNLKDRSSYSIDKHIEFITRKKIDQQKKDPVFDNCGVTTEGWYFWDETGAYAHGPYCCKDTTRAKLKAYAETI